MSRMPRWIRSIAVASLVPAALGVAACSDDEGARSESQDEAASQETTTTTTPEAVAAAVEQPGEWDVGVASGEVTGARGRTLAVQIWYPAEPGSSEGATPATYPFPGLEVPSATGFADLPVAEGSFPLVVYSHGNGGLRYVSSFLTEHLASQGFVVVAPDHTGNTAIDTFAGTGEERTQVALDRPADVSATIDAAVAGDPGFEELAPVIDAESIGVIGHSFGGYTALAVAGGVGDIAPDDRVDAIVGLAASTSGLSDESLEAIDIPVLLEWASDDTTVEVATNAPRPDELIPGKPYVRADIKGAQHQSFTDVCSYKEQVANMPELPQALVEAVNDYASEGCSEGQLDIDEAHRIINRLTTAFLLENLKGEEAYSVLLESPSGDDPTLSTLENR